MDIKNIKEKIHRNRYNILLICILLFVGIPLTIIYIFDLIDVLKK